jgi:DNA-binding SARP family transcriptional activator/Tfp pilus assembly protein PilF
MVNVRVQLLGPLRAWRGDTELNLGGPQQRAVLALVAVASASGHHASRTELVEALWGERPPASAENTIQTYLKHLRRELEPDRPARAPSRLLQRTSGGYLLPLSDVDLDLVRFRNLVASALSAYQTGDRHRAAEQLGEGLKLWKGPPLAGSPPLSSHPRLVTLARERWSAVERYGEAMLAVGRAGEALPLLAEAAATCPLDEAIHAHLIRAYHALGKREQAFATFHAVRRRLADELGVDPGPQVTTAHDALLAEDRAQGLGHRPATSGVPSQLPGASGSFTGRVDQLRQLDKVLAGTAPVPAVVICAISGTAGVGKTTLAVRWAHQVAERFPDGQLFVNLRGFGAAREPNQSRSDPTGHAMSPAEAIRTVLDALEVPPQRIPATVEAQTGLYRSLLAGRRMLILLDNARDTDQVRPLLPGAPGSLVLVTSRNQLTGLVATDGAHPLTLDLLPDPEARELLNRRIGAGRLAAEPAAVDQIVDRCAGLPLALALVAARAAIHPEHSLGSIADVLSEGLDAFSTGDTTTDVRAVFSWSYRALSLGAQRLFRLLALHPGPELGRPAAASLTGLPAGQVKPLLAELVQSHLITEHLPGRYTLHDLLRAYATELAGQDEQPAATRRMVDHYLHTAHTAAVLLDPHRYRVTPEPPSPGVTPEALADREQAQVWFTTEHPVLLAVAAIADRAGLDTLAWQFTTATAVYLYRRGHYPAMVESQDIALRAAQRLADPAMQARSQRTIAYPLVLLGRLDEAAAHLERALELSRDLDDPIAMAYVHLAFSDLRDAQGSDRHVTIDHARQALDLFETGGNRTGQARALNVIGWEYSQLGDYQQALATCRRALALQEEIGDRHDQSIAWDSIGYIHHQLGDYPQAIASYQQALALLRGYGDRLNEAETLDHLGDSYQAVGQPDDARTVWRDATTILDELAHSHADQVRAKLADQAGGSASR